MASYRMTAARKAALRKAQLTSARKRRGRRKFSAPKLSRGHKRAIAVAAAGAIVSAGVYKYTSSRKRPVQSPPGGSKVPSDGRPQRRPYSENKGWRLSDNNAGESAPDRVIPRGVFGKQTTYSSATHPDVIRIMSELNGQPIMGKGKNRNKRQGKRVVVFGTRPPYVAPEPSNG